MSSRKQRRRDPLLLEAGSGDSASEGEGPAAAAAAASSSSSSGRSRRAAMTEEERAAERARQREKRKRKRKSKDEAPLEVSAKQRVPPRGAGKKNAAAFRPRDPRFDSMCGEYSEAAFRTSYKFLDSAKEDEFKSIQDMMRKTKDPDVREKLRRVADKYRSEMASQRRRDVARAERSRLRKMEVKAVEQGKKPFFLKKSDRKKVQLAEQFEDLEKSGKLGSFMAKRRKKNAAKDRRWMAEERREH